MIAVQCWDDGIVDDIRLTGILRKHGAKASFNLNIGLHGQNRPTSGWKHQGKEVFRLARGELIDVYAGFLVANHCFNHPSLADLPLAEAAEEIRRGREGLEQLFGYGVKGFAYPNGSHNRAVHEKVREAGHFYARTTENADPVLPVADPMAFNSSCHFLDAGFWSKFEQVKAEDGVFYLWGHSYELMTEEDWDDFDAKIERITREAKWMDLPDLFV